MRGLCVVDPSSARCSAPGCCDLITLLSGLVRANSSAGRPASLIFLVKPRFCRIYFLIVARCAGKSAGSIFTEIALRWRRVTASVRACVRGNSWPEGGGVCPPTTARSSSLFTRASNHLFPDWLCRAQWRQADSRPCHGLEGPTC